VDVSSAGTEEKSAVQLKIAPQTAYVTITNQRQQEKQVPELRWRYENEKLILDGTRPHTSRQHGSGCEAGDSGYASEPSRFAATVLVEALKRGRDVKPWHPPRANCFQGALGELHA